MSQYFAVSSSVVLVHPGGERRHAAELADFGTAKQAAEMLNRARYLNDAKRRYTAAARLIAEVETLPGFRWIA